MTGVEAEAMEEGKGDLVKKGFARGLGQGVCGLNNKGETDVEGPG